MDLFDINDSNSSLNNDLVANLQVYSKEIELKYGEINSYMTNVKTVLEESGSEWNNMVDVTVFLTNMKHDFKIYNELYAQYFKEAQPCRTTVEIKSLPTPIAIELKCIAVID